MLKELGMEYCARERYYDEAVSIFTGEIATAAQYAANDTVFESTTLQWHPIALPPRCARIGAASGSVRLTWEFADERFLLRTFQKP